MKLMRGNAGDIPMSARNGKKRRESTRAACPGGLAGPARGGLDRPLHRQDAGRAAPLHQRGIVDGLHVFGRVFGLDAAPVRVRGPAGLGDHDRLFGVKAGHAVDLVLRVAQRLVDGLGFPHRAGVQRDEIELDHQVSQPVLPRHAVLAERDGLRDALPASMHGVDHPGDGNEVVGPVDGGLVANRHREHGVLVGRGEHDAPFEFGRVRLCPGRQFCGAEATAPGAAGVVHLGARLGAEHHLEIEPVFADHGAHAHALGVQRAACSVQRAAVEAQHAPVLRKEVQVFADLFEQREGLVVRALAVSAEADI